MNHIRKFNENVEVTEIISNSRDMILSMEDNGIKINVFSYEFGKSLEKIAIRIENLNETKLDMYENDLEMAKSYLAENGYEYLIAVFNAKHFHSTLKDWSDIFGSRFRSIDLIFNKEII